MGGGTPIAKRIFDALVLARGPAVDAGNPQKIAYYETLAEARAIAAAWSTNERLGNQRDARRMTSMLERWEKIYGLRVDAKDTLAERRTRVAVAQARVGQASLSSAVYNEAVLALGEFFYAIEPTAPTVAQITVPSVSYPWGSVSDGAPWSSTVAHVLIRVQVPTGRADAELYERVAALADALEPMLPAWATWDWYRAPEVGAPVSVVGGPSAGGFYLDERNLNESVFDV